MTDEAGTQDQTGGAGESGEGLAQELIAQVGELKAQLRAAASQIEAMNRRSELQRQLVQQRCIDLASALELAEKHEKQGEAARPVEAVVEQVRKQAPGLFRSRSSLTAAISASVPLGKGAEAAGLQDLMSKARSGDRASLLLYLQARRDRQARS